MTSRTALFAVITFTLAACAPNVPPSEEPLAPIAPITNEQPVPPEEGGTVAEDTEVMEEEPATDAMEQEGAEQEGAMMEKTDDGDAAMEADEAPATRMIPMTVDNWLFSPATITVRKGELVSLQLTGVGGTHGFTAPDLGISVPISAGEMQTVAIPTDAAGTFSFFCSVPCGAGHSAMRGEIVIEE